MVREISAPELKARRKGQHLAVLGGVTVCAHLCVATQVELAEDSARLLGTCALAIDVSARQATTALVEFRGDATKPLDSHHGRR